MIIHLSSPRTALPLKHYGESCIVKRFGLRTDRVLASAVVFEVTCFDFEVSGCQRGAQNPKPHTDLREIYIMPRAGHVSYSLDS